jgi:hypothetical protein
MLMGRKEERKVIHHDRKEGRKGNEGREMKEGRKDTQFFRHGLINIHLIYIGRGGREKKGREEGKRRKVREGRTARDGR